VKYLNFNVPSAIQRPRFIELIQWDFNDPRINAHQTASRYRTRLPIRGVGLRSDGACRRGTPFGGHQRRL